MPGKLIPGEKRSMAYKKASNAPFKMKGSAYKQKTHPKHPVTPPSEKESKKSKGTLSKDRGIKLIDKEHIKTQLKEGKFWGWPIDKWGGGKR